MKKLILAAALILASANALAGSQTYYYHVGYEARVDDRIQCIFQKSVVPFKPDLRTNFQDELTKQHVKFLMEKHPEYYRGWIRGYSGVIEGRIKVHSLTPVYPTVKDALEVRSYELARCKSAAERDPKSYLPPLEIDDEFRFKN